MMTRLLSCTLVGIGSFLDDGRILRDNRWLLEIPGGGKPERFFDCGEHRDGSGYQDVAGADTAEAQAARDGFAKILAAMPEPKPRPGGSDAAKGKKAKSGGKRQKKAAGN